VPKPGLCDEDLAANQARKGAIWFSCKMEREFWIQQLGHTINLKTLLLLLLLLSNFSLLRSSWETFPYPMICNQQQ
jgi:hypothetical protein